MENMRTMKMNSPPLPWSYKFFTIGALLALIVAIFNIAETSSSASSKGKKDLKGEGISAATRISRETIFAVTSTGNLITFNSDNPSVITKSVAISNVSGSLIGIDFRPKTGVLYGLTTSSLYTINTNTGAATFVASLGASLTGTAFGVDFNPVVDRIRVVSNTGQNIRFNPDTGAVANTAPSDVALSNGGGGTPGVVAAAYTNDVVGATSTTLYDLDATSDMLVVQGGNPVPPGSSPNLGVLTNVGSLGVDITDAAFDISDFSKTAYAAMFLNGGSSSNFYTIDLNTGAANRVGTTAIGGTSAVTVTAMAVGFNGETLMGLTQSGKLVTFNSSAPNVITRTVQITGLLNGDVLAGIDYRPANGNLMAVAKSGQVYTINPLSGAAVAVGTPGTTLTGTDFGVDFNPVPDRIRVVGNNGQNVRLNPITGGLAGTDTALSYASGATGPTGIINVVGVAYTNNFAGTAATTLYDINASSGPSGALLVMQGGLNGAPSPNSGSLTNVGALGGTGTIFTTNDVGFDISASTGAAFASLTLTSTPSVSNLYTINLTTGAATLAGPPGGSVIGGGEVIKDITVANTVEIVYALNVNNQLTCFASTAPGVLLDVRTLNPNPTPATINGLNGDTLRGIDFRPATGGLYALGTSGRVYLINFNTSTPNTVMATQVGTTVNTLSGTDFGFDFNPVPDRIRVISDAGQNIRLNPITGGLAGTDTTLSGAATGAVAAAYTNNFVRATVTTLYDINASNNGTLFRQGGLNGTPSPNGGVLTSVGTLGVSTSNEIGFDISGVSGVALAALNPSGGTTSSLYTINLTPASGFTGALATPVGASGSTGLIGGGVVIRDISVGSANGIVGLNQEHALLFAADTLNNRIQSSADDGATWKVVGFGAGTGLGFFNGPRGVTADATGLIVFVADTLNNRIQASTDGGSTWSLVAGPGTAVGTVNRPEGVAYDATADVLYVADTGNNRIQMIMNAKTGLVIPTLYANSTAGTGIGQFNQPTGIAVDANSTVYVADTLNNRIQFNNTNLNTGWAIFAGASAGTAVGKVNQPRGLFVSSTNVLYVADTNNNRVMTNTNGLTTGWSVLFGAAPAPGGVVTAPRGVTLTVSGSVFVADTGANRIQRRTSAGVVSTVGVPGTAAGGTGKFNAPSGIR